MKSLEAFEAFWKKEISPQLRGHKKTYLASVPSTGKYWAMAFIPIPFILGLSFLVMFTMYDEVEAIKDISIIWGVGWSIILFAAYKLFDISKKRRLFMNEFKANIFTKCIDYLDTGLTYNYDKHISSKELLESSVFDRYRFLSGEDQFTGEMDGKPFSFSEVSLSYTKKSGSTKKKIDRYIQYFMIIEVGLSEALSGTILIYPESKPFHKTKSGRIGINIVVNFLIILLNMFFALLFNRKGSVNSLNTNVITGNRSIYHLNPPKDMPYSEESVIPDTFHVAAHHTQEVKKHLTPDLFIKLEAIMTKVNSDVFVSFFNKKMLLAMPLSFGNETSSFMDFDQKGKGITTFDTFKKFYQDLKLYNDIVFILSKPS